MTIGRRDFLKWAGMAVAGAAVAAGGACSRKAQPPAPPQDLMKVGLYTWTEIVDLPDQMQWLGLNYARAGVMSDALMAFCAARHIEVLLNIGPTLARSDAASDADFVAAYVKQVSDTLNRFGPRGTYWSDNPNVKYSPIVQLEICNEPNFGYGFPSTVDQVAPLYAQVLIASYNLIKTTWPEVLVVGFAAGGASDAAPGFISAAFTALQNAGNLNCFDVVSIHPYGKDKPPEQTIVEQWGSWSVRDSIDAVKSAMAKFEVTKPLWITEVGYEISTADGGTFGSDNGQSGPKSATVTPAQQAAYTVRMNMAAARAGIPRVYHMFVVDSDSYNGGWFGPAPEHAPRPVAVAMRQVIQMLSGSTNLDIVLDGAPDKPGDPFAYRFSTPRGSVLVAWCQDPKTQALDLPSGTHTEITDMLGAKIADTTDTSYNAALSETPIFLHSVST